MNCEQNILIVDDDRELGETIQDLLSTKGYKTTWVGNGGDAVNSMQKQHFCMVLLDLLLPDTDGIQVLQRVLQIDPAAVVIMMSGHGTIENAVKATHSGAYDWLEKPLEKERLFLAVRNGLDKCRLVQDKERFLSEIKEQYRMVSVSKPMQQVFNLIDKVAGQNTSVLITGESGTGKELVAGAIHLNSSRAAGPFVRVNCAAVPETLIESELFGHTRGAFTGAHTDKQGKFQAADGGTLFLDEIGDLSQSAQAKILRAIESGEVERVGDAGLHKVNVRLITATNKDLRKLIAAGAFREDLFHRINVVEIHIPSLKERMDDIVPLAQHYLEQYCEENNIQLKTLEPAAEAVLMAHDWPGNVRELRNVAEKIAILVESADVTAQQVAAVMEIPQKDGMADGGRTLAQARQAFDKSFITKTLEMNDWNVSRAARVLDVHRSSLYDKMKQLGIEEVSGSRDT
ncbi:MAG: sigma-54-dependent Fis family transcriptional regulator [Chitinispirillaceae bacterium]|nr:sigma-54-dependent Fis family transcriptional regulator [Chitinispirillaceae bacterium]